MREPQQIPLDWMRLTKTVACDGVTVFKLIMGRTKSDKIPWFFINLTATESLNVGCMEGVQAVPYSCTDSAAGNVFDSFRVPSVVCILPGLISIGIVCCV